MTGLSPPESSSLGVGSVGTDGHCQNVVAEPVGVYLYQEAGQANPAVASSKARISLVSRTFLPSHFRTKSRGLGTTEASPDRMGKDQVCEYWGQSQVGLGAQWSINTALSSCLSSWQPPWAEGPPTKAWDGTGTKRERIGVPYAPKPTVALSPCAVTLMAPRSAIRQYRQLGGSY